MDKCEPKDKKARKSHLGIAGDAWNKYVFIQNYTCWQNFMCLFYIYSPFPICLDAICEWKTGIGWNQYFGPGESINFYRLFNSSGPQYSEIVE